MGWRPPRHLAMLAALALLAGCATQPAYRGPPPAELSARIAAHMPAEVADKAAWAADIEQAFRSQRIKPMAENICAVLAVIEQESGYQADPTVPGLGEVARREIVRRAQALHIPELVVDMALQVRSGDGRRYADRLAAVRTEGELSALYTELTARVPLGRRLFEGFNPVDTAGSMQVSIAFAEAYADAYPWPIPGSVREEVFTRRGGLWFGIHRLLGYDTPYRRKIHRFADYNAGRYASRNAAFQQAVALASGRELALDGDLLVPGAGLDEPGATERAVRSLSPELHMDARQIRAALEAQHTLGFNDTPLFQRVFALAEARAGKHLPREIIPGIVLDSPKISRKLTTAWFARRVYQRYRDCLHRNGPG